MKIIVALVGGLFVFSAISINVKASECNCKEAEFNRLPPGVTGEDMDKFFTNGRYEKFLANIDAKEGQGEGDKYDRARYFREHCGSELNTLSGNNACPENAVIACESNGEHGGVIDGKEGGISPCNKNKKCKPEPDDRYRRVCA